MIKELPEEVVRKIAAGEVITGAFSVVKELVENSLDAGAKKVEIEIKSGGKSYIRVTDDGVGMTLEEILLAVRPHTTSKIEKLEDLYSIRTYGFRGEALSSIVNVSRVEIVSRKRGEKFGSVVKLAGGEIVETVERVEAPVGTTVKVRDLFFNTPARRKFLKSASIEGRMVTEQVQKFLLSRSDVHFVYVRDGKVVYNTPPVEDLRTRVGIVMPDSKAREMIEISKESGYVSVWGYVSKPGVWRNSRTGVYIFVNGRYVIDDELVSAMERGYGEALVKGKHPMAIIFIELPPDSVDVNVHPQKVEVKFSDPDSVRKVLEEAVGKALRSSWKRRMEFGGKRKVYGVPERKDSFFERPELFEMRKEKVELSNERVAQENLRFLMVLRDRYIVLESEEGIVFIDYHAAHERLIYEELKKEIERGLKSTYLIAPIDMELDEVSLETLKNNENVLEKLGFRFEIIGNSVRIVAVPEVLPVDLVQETLLEMVEELRLSGVLGVPETIQKILSNMACKRAMRTGDRITEPDALELVRRIEEEGILSCPHGRPIAFELKYSDLDGYFERE